MCFIPFAETACEVASTRDLKRASERRQTHTTYSLIWFLLDPLYRVLIIQFVGDSGSFFNFLVHLSCFSLFGPLHRISASPSRRNSGNEPHVRQITSVSGFAQRFNGKKDLLLQVLWNSPPRAVQVHFYTVNSSLITGIECLPHSSTTPATIWQKNQNLKNALFFHSFKYTLLFYMLLILMVVLKLL